MKRTLMASALALLAACAAAADAPNLLRGAGFEEAEPNGAVAGWTAESAGMASVAFARDAAEKRTGAASARLTVGPAEKLSWPAFSQKLDVQPGQCYNVEAYVKTRDVSKIAYVAADYLDAKGARVSFTGSGSVAGTSPGWTRISLKAAIPTGAVAMAVRLILYGTGTAWFDDVAAARDETAEKLMEQLKKPLPPAMLARAIAGEGDTAPLHRLLQNAAKGGKIVVGVIGGSITQGASASSPARHYAAYVVEWLKEHFPAAEVSFVNAGIGATGSNYGCLRAARDLLSKAPNLVVVEYAVNDGPTQECAETYEGLVRQVLTSEKRPAALLLFMMNQSGGNAQEWQAKVGQHYALPMLSYRDLLWPEIEAKRMAWSDISPDAVHPNDLGHGYAGKLLTAMLERALTGVPKEPVAAPAGPLPAPLLTDAYQFTSLFEADALKPVANTGWAYDPAQGWNKAFTSATPGSAIEFEVEGEQVFLTYWRIRGAMGKAKITVDGGEPAVHDAWFDQTWGGYRQMVKIASGKPVIHRVRVELLPEKHPESTGHEFRVLCLGAAGVRK